MTQAPPVETRHDSSRRPTVNAIMSDEATALPERLTVHEALARLRVIRDEQKRMFYAYVVNEHGQLAGVLSMRDLILAPVQTTLARIMRPDVTAIPAEMDQEQAARLISEQRYLALPVVDEMRRLLGIVTADDAMQILEKQTTEDVQRLFGVSPDERLESSLRFSFTRRLPWLLVNLMLALSGAAVVAWFQSTIALLAVLAIYMPVIAGMGGNATAQAMAVTIRGMALGERPAVGRVVMREMRVGLVSGGVIGLLAALVAWALHMDQGWVLGLIVWFAMLCNLTLGCIWGTAVPQLMRWLGFDPAQSATIFTTTVTDMLGFFLLLMLATLLLV